MKIGGLNPYSNGMLTWISSKPLKTPNPVCLNPYSNGMLTWIL